MKAQRGRYLVAALTLLLPLWGQQPKGSPALRAITRRLYSEQSELFAEFRPLVVGQQIRLTAHLTKIGDRFRAYSEGAVRLTLTVQDAVVEAATQAPERAGVFRLNVTPTKPGSGRIVIELDAQGSSDRFVLEDVPVYADIETALAKQPASDDTGLIRYAKELSWKEDFATAPVKTVAFASGQTGVSSIGVPRTAVIQNQGIPFVYVQRTPERFELRSVKTGRSSGESIEITDGVRAGDRIVIRSGDKMPRK